MHSRKTTIFVSGAFTGKTWEQVTKERQAIHNLAHSFNLEVVEQFIGYQGKEDFELKDYNPSFILAKDKNLIKEADAFVIDLSRISIGATCELTIAKELFGKQVYAVALDPKLKKHPWVRFYCDAIFDSLEAALQQVKVDFSGKPHLLMADKRQYDPIAKEYRLVEETPAQKYIYDPAIIQAVQQSTNLNHVVVLHGGSGYRARLAKQAGAKQVTCIDISQTQIQIAESEEQTNPLGISYLALDPYSRDFLANVPQELIGQANLVLGAFLLDHAMSISELDIVLDNIFQLLTPGGEFFGLMDNPNIQHPTDPKYGVKLSLDQSVNPDQDGVPRRVSICQSILGEPMEVLHFYNYKWKSETILKALRNHQFGPVSLSTPPISPEGLAQFKPNFWQAYIQNPTTISVQARKS